METTNYELEINYEYNYKQFKEKNLHPSTLTSILCCNVIPFIIVMICELITLSVAITIGFNDNLILLLIIFPAIYALFVLMYTLFMLIFLNRNWKKISKLPLEQKWFFTEEGIILDKTYSKSHIDWTRIKRVIISNKYIIFLLTDNKRINIPFGVIPKNVLTDEQYDVLKTILLKHLDPNKITIRADKKRSKQENNTKDPKQI